MYSIVLMTALAAGTATPAWHHRCGGCYGGGWVNGCHGWNGCHGCHGSYGYGFAGGCYGYHGGCYGGFGYNYGDPYYGWSTGCYGCHGGHSGYGPAITPDKDTKPKPRDPYPPINPKKGGNGGAEEVGPLKEKKEVDKPKPGGEESVRAKVRIEIPEGGKLFVDGRHVAVPAGTRVFQTPPLTPGQNYYYDIRIEVDRNGITRGEEQRVVVQPGLDAYVHFPTLGPPGSYAARAGR
jgi:uncharacterized protein (TIGR03000 family)